MTDKTDATPAAGSTAEGLKRAMEMKRQGAGVAAGAPSVRRAERDAAAKAAALSKPAYTRASKRG